MRDPYFIQIGLDFGTSYSKCVWRDINRNKAWVHIPSNPADNEYPFLIPSALQIRGSRLVIGDPSFHYHPDGLPHVKRALVKVALREWDDPVLKPFLQALGDNLKDRLTSFVAACAVYLLAGILGGVKGEIRRRRAGFGEHRDDYMPVNLAIPVADAEQPQVNALFQRVLETAFEHADYLAGHPPLPLCDLVKCVPRRRPAVDGAGESMNGSCFIYPEVSAGVQGFVRSPVSNYGIYLFSETGAATVDQSVFILWRRAQEGNMLTYLSARVLPLGSSQIEQWAALSAGNVSWKSLEEWRRRKENGGTDLQLSVSRNQVSSELTQSTVVTLFEARRKLNLDEQLNDIRVMFGGGGHIDDPYETGVMRAFGERSVFGVKTFHPPVIGMQQPTDLEPSQLPQRWMPRLWVAYGLAFHRLDLAEHMYPSQVSEGRRIRKHRSIEPPRQEDV